MKKNLRLRRLWLLCGWAMLVAAVWLSLIGTPPQVVEIPHLDKLKHLLAYAVLMGWFGQIYTTQGAQRSWLIGLVLMGIMLEFLQGWGGVRFFEYADMLANTLGALLGYWLTRGPLAGTLARVDLQLARKGT